MGQTNRATDEFEQREKLTELNAVELDIIELNLIELNAKLNAIALEALDLSLFAFARYDLPAIDSVSKKVG